MSERVLVTGGAGFIGRHVCMELLAEGYEVRAYDALVQQVHGFQKHELDAEIDLRVGDVRDGHRLRAALSGVDAVVHLAAQVGVGQSMYQPHEYIDANVRGTAVLWDALFSSGLALTRKLVVASSMSIYGEGGPGRVSESRAPDPRSVYALTKYDQERLCLLMGYAYDFPVTALRFFNVYGPGQALANPYTGVMAIFGTQLLNGHRPYVYEDGHQTRDFVHVVDVARAVRCALKHPESNGEAINVGTGRALEVGELAKALAFAMDIGLQPEISGRYRFGDIRHCVADTTKAHLLLDWEAQVSLADGLRDLAKWISVQEAPSNVDGANAELKSRGLLRPVEPEPDEPGLGSPADLAS